MKIGVLPSHLQHNAPLTTDIEAIARPVSDWARTSPDAQTVARDGAEAVPGLGRIHILQQGKVAEEIVPIEDPGRTENGRAEAGKRSLELGREVELDEVLG